MLELLPHLMPVPVMAVQSDCPLRLAEDDPALAACGHKSEMSLNIQTPPLYLTVHFQIFLKE